MNELVQRLEDELESYDAPKRIATIVAIVLLMAIVTWYFFIDPQSESIKRSQQSMVELEKKVSSVHLVGLKNKIKKIEKKNIDALTRTKNLKRGILFLRSNLDAANLRYSEQGYLKSMELLLRRSVELGLRIDKVQEHNLEASKAKKVQIPSLFRYRYITVTGGGSYASVLRLSYFIESLSLPLRIEKIHIGRDDNKSLLFECEVGYYGVKL